MRRVVPVVAVLLSFRAPAFAERSSGQAQCGDRYVSSGSARTMIRITDVVFHYAYDSYMNAPSIQEGVSWSVGAVTYERSPVSIPAELLAEIRIDAIQLRARMVRRDTRTACLRSTPTNALNGGPGEGVTWMMADLSEWDRVFNYCSEEQAKSHFRAGFDVDDCSIISLRMTNAIERIERHIEGERKSASSSPQSSTADVDYNYGGSDKSASQKDDKSKGDTNKRDKGDGKDTAPKDKVATNTSGRDTDESADRPQRHRPSPAPTQYEIDMKAAELKMKEQLAHQERMRTDPNYALADSIAKMDPSSRKVFMGILLGVMAVGVGAVLVNQIADDPELGALAAGIPSTIVTSGGFLGASMRHLGSRSHGPNRHDTPLLGERGWFSTGSYRFSILGGYSKPAIVDNNGASVTGGMPCVFGFQAALRYSLLRLSISNLYRSGDIASRYAHEGLETSLGVGIQLWRAGLLSPYAEARLTTYVSSTEELMSPDLEDINGIDYVVGNTFTLKPFGYREQGEARSRFFFDVSYTVAGRGISNEQLVFALGFDRAW